MYKLIACLTMTSVLTVSAYAETPKFPDPSTLPPEATAKTETTTSGTEEASIKKAELESKVTEMNTKDNDKDGVADDADLCPGTAAGSEVNQVGCAKTENINLKGVNFETGSSILTATSLPILDEAANTLKKYPDLKIEVGGHTDSSGDKTANEKLSQSRAETVMKYLVEKGAKAELLSAKGYGPNQAIADNATPEDKAQNRRVELKILP